LGINSTTTVLWT